VWVLLRGNQRKTRNDFTKGTAKNKCTRGQEGEMGSPLKNRPHQSCREKKGRKGEGKD